MLLRNIFTLLCVMSAVYAQNSYELNNANLYENEAQFRDGHLGHHFHHQHHGGSFAAGGIINKGFGHHNHHDDRHKKIAAG